MSVGAMPETAVTSGHEICDEASGLASRWSARSEDGVSRRDALLEALRTGERRSGPEELRERDLRGIRLVGEDLVALELSGFDMRGADLSRADLTGAKLVGAKLAGAKLFGAKLEGAELLAADLSGTDLSECSAERAGFGSANLEGATLFSASLEGATFTKARLVRADLRAARLERARLREADLTRADLSSAVMPGADLESSCVAHAIFDAADLSEARLRGLTGYDSASWIGTDIFGVDPCGAYMVVRDIRDQNYLHEFRKKSRVNAALYWAWWATSDCGRSFLRWGVCTALLALVFAGLYELVALDRGDYPTSLTSLYYSVVTLTTLGYGDVLPASTAAQVLAMAEVISGYVMLGGLLSIFSNKMARRAD